MYFALFNSSILIYYFLEICFNVQHTFSIPFYALRIFRCIYFQKDTCYTNTRMYVYIYIFVANKQDIIKEIHTCLYKNAYPKKRPFNFSSKPAGSLQSFMVEKRNKENYGKISILKDYFNQISCQKVYKTFEPS